jgi:carbamate kinase
MTISEAMQYAQEGHFAPGSMGPKIDAAIQYTSATGKPTIITLPETMIDALERKTGTWIV